LDRGIIGGSDAWLVVGAMALLARLGKRAMRREPQVLYYQKLIRGDGVIISHEDPL
jgi:hypothetical protein